MYNIEYTQRAKKDIKKLEKNIQIRIINSLEKIKIRPEHYIERLVGLPYYKLRIGDYRAILAVKNQDLVVLIIEVKNRKNVYKK